MIKKRKKILDIISSKLYWKFLLCIIAGYLLIAIVGFFINFFIASSELRNGKMLLVMLLVYVLLSLAVGLVVSLILSYIFTMRVMMLKNKAEKMMLLDFSEELSISGDDELSEVSIIMNNLASTLSSTLSILEVQNKELTKRIEQEKESEKERLEVIAAISHELKTPIAVLRGQTEGMIHQIGKFKNRDEYLTKNLVILENMNSLVLEMIEMNRLNSLGSINYERIDLSVLLKNQVERILVLIEEKSQHLISDIIPEAPIVGDEKFLSRAINNILMNAYKYSPTDAQIRVSLKDEADAYLLSIENTGVFIPLDQIDKLFNQFVRLEKSGNKQTGGNGIGLYVVKKILELHNYQYQIHNAKEGVCFNILINKT